MHRTTAILVILAAGIFLLGSSALADSLGTATTSKLSSCPSTGLAKGTCYRVTISGCAENPQSFVAIVKVNEAVNRTQPIGTVFFTTGGGGADFYDSFDGFVTGDTRCNTHGNCGLFVVQTVNSAGYRTVQTAFKNPGNPSSEPNGWLFGPATGGPRALACRYATLLHVVWTNILNRDTTKPVCATGNSGGSAAVAYSLAHYGLGSSTGPGPVVSMVEVTSGPVFSRIDRGCQKSPPQVRVSCPSGVSLSEGYGLALALEFIDPTFSGQLSTAVTTADICAQQIQNGGNNSLFLHDSIMSDDSPTLDYPETFVNVVFGDQDLSMAVPQGMEWYNGITSSKAQSCVVGAHHALASSFEGANQIANDLTTFCKK